MDDRTKQHPRDGAASLAILAATFLMLSPPEAFAAHDGRDLAGLGGESCYNCHTLDINEGDANTSFINKQSRTFPRIKDYDGLPVSGAPANLGCTYCHNDNGRTTNMKPAITHFQGRTSFHPVGFNFVGAGSETTNEYLSTLGSATSQELDCIDCHDLVAYGDGRDDPATGPDEGNDSNASTSLGGATDKYPEHGPPVDPVNNPFMLRNVTAANEYDAFCRTCHRSDVPQTIKTVSMQLSAHADNAAARPLVENDGTVLRTADLNGDGIADPTGLATTAQCTVCHDTHYSSNRRLFNDGHEQHKTGAGMVADTPITSGNCTSLCHYAGDWNNMVAGGNYYQHGHGMAQSTYKYKDGKPDASGNYITMGYGCTQCHVGIDPAQKAHADDYASEPDEKVRYIKRFNLTGTMQSGDTGSAMGNPLVGICLSCHLSYEEHQTVSSGGVGCQDCHDEHAEGSGVGSNVMMIPERAKKPGSYVAPIAAFTSKPGTELITYDSTKWDTATSPYVARPGTALDFFRTADANGMCDSAECHAGKSYTPLNTWINNAGTTHSQGQQVPGTDCNSCHAHNGDDAGGWRALSSCNDCHGANGAGHAVSQGKNATTHTSRHRTSSTYIGVCSDCHSNTGPASGSPDHDNGTVNFGGTSMSTAFNYVKGANFDDTGCGTAANGCHNAEPGEWAAHSLGLNACVNCHLASGKALGQTPTSGLHAVGNVTRHDATLQAGNCVNCHDAAGPSSAHLNGSLNTSLSATFTFHANVLSYDSAGCQAAASCHGGGDSGTWRRRWAGVVDTVPGTIGNDTPGQPVCQNCHGDFTGWRWDGAAATTTNHTDPYTGNTGDQMSQHAACQACHGWGDAAYAKTWKTGRHGNGSIDMNGPDATHGTAAGAQYNDSTGGCLLACHSSAFVMSTNSGWTTAYGDFGSGDCGGCHGPGGSGPTVVWPAGDAAGRRTSYGSHLGTTPAEEANGFLGGVATWISQCNKCHDFHNGAIKVPSPPASWTDPSGRLSGTNMRTRLGLTYATETNVAVHLGGTAQGGASEAEFCWGCHDANVVSEWGFNTKTTPAGYPATLFATQHDGSQESENRGWIYTSVSHATKTSDWAAGYWQSEYDALTAKRIASIHSTSFDPAGQSSSVATNVSAGIVNRTAPAFEGKGFIRCSNCHDVHDTFGPDGKPYLRGRWTGNPYPPELPPRSGYTYTVGANIYYPTPRGRSSARDKGGYFIDQNSNWPTNNAALDTLAETAELCTLCHGTDVNGMDFYTGSKLWLAGMTNGHSNAALGGTGASRQDLFTASRYGTGMGSQAYVPGPPYNCGPYGDECDSTYPLSWLMNWCCDGVPVVRNSGWFGGPEGTFTQGGGDYANWYGTGTIGGASGAGTMAHKFTCSKCHSPHATGLPALLTQSCIDPAQGNFTINGYSGVNLIANNCHRKTSATDGWHVLVPGQ